ncbi:MAG TPA: porphobilinogen synthase, partial [Actinomycetota bacterium]|nr:porphobilinogen synthase [Actinomycetota bacterium]
MTVKRYRRLRQSENIRKLVAETRLDPSRLVLPIFVSDEAEVETPLESMPGHFHWPSSRVGLLAKQAESLGIPGVLIFGVTESKDASASQAFAADGPAQRAIHQIKSSTPGMAVFADTCLCGYTDTGHCGIVENEKILNDASVE